VLKLRDDRTKEVGSAQATYASGSSAVGGGVCEQRHATQRVLPALSFGTLNRHLVITMRNGAPEDWKRKGGFAGQIMSGIAGLVLIGLALTGVKACLSRGTSSAATASQQTRIVAKADKIVTGQVEVGAGKAIYYPLEIRQDMLEPVVKGSFEASGGSGNDIVAATRG